MLAVELQPREYLKCSVDEPISRMIDCRALTGSRGIPVTD